MSDGFSGLEVGIAKWVLTEIDSAMFQLPSAFGTLGRSSDCKGTGENFFQPPKLVMEAFC